jgi:hypothetical protein
MRSAITIILTSVFFLFAFVGCNKWKDKWFQDYYPPSKGVDFCRITEVRQSAGPLVTDRTGAFYYSSNGNLDSVVFNDDRGIVHYWKYNAQNVLEEYRESFNHNITDFRTLHKYASQNGKVIRDTAWLEGASGYIIEVWALEYDSKGRVIRETGHRIDAEAPGMTLPEKVYVYNAEGNLIDATGYNIFDNEINFLRTNQVLQFIDRDYSMNNEKSYLLGYTPYHLPVGFRPPAGDTFLGGDCPARISYSCVPRPPGDGQKNDCQIVFLKHILPSDNRIWEGTVFFTPDGRPMTLQYWDKKFNSEASVYVFEYDTKRRLVAFSTNIGIYRYETHSYDYVGDRVTTDSFYTDIEEITQISTFQYDNQNRIVKEDIHVTERYGLPVSEYNSKTYTYDNRGNLINNVVSSYDNKVNYLRTDPAWMLIHRNFSKNNPNYVTQYNNKQLPLGFSTSTNGFLVFKDPIEIRYTCGERVK